ncbi:MAG: hypothetical protein Q9193_002553 [Seirophora villosa]
MTSSSSSQAVQPSHFGGHGRQMSAANQYDDSTFGGLKGQSFNSCCPPDVQPNTRVVALCGIADWISPATIALSSEEEDDRRSKPRSTIRKIYSKSKDVFSTSRKHARKDAQAAQKARTSPRGRAAPDQDGWFFSDFFLFNQLLRGMGANQLWLTCESPSQLVNKYEEYAHGEPEDRRVVLHAKTLPALQQENNLRVFSRRDLLQDFLRTFESECRIAAQNHQPVLLLVFGHGDEFTHGIAIGGSGDPKDAPRLTIAQMKRVLRGLDVSVTLLTTACYSGGWVYQPELNISAATASGPKNETLSWMTSVGGRFHGSFWATAVTQALIKFEDERLIQSHPLPIESIDPEVVRSSRTFAKLAEVIYDTLVTEVDRSATQHHIRFAAQDDAWESEWRQRSGVPLAIFRQRWQSLRPYPPQQSSVPTRSRAAGNQSRAQAASQVDVIEGKYGCKKGISRHQAKLIVRDLCSTYLSSFPGMPNRASNTTVQTLANGLIKGEDMSQGMIKHLHLTLLHRMNLMRSATAFKNFLGLDFPDCNQFDVDEWLRSVPYDLGQDTSKYDLFDDCRSKVRDARIFPLPPTTACHGHLLSLSYPKGTEYLAAMFTESGLSPLQIDEALARLIQLTENHIELHLSGTVKYDRTVRDTLKIAFNSVGRQLRSPSPRKRGPLPSFDEVMER